MEKKLYIMPNRLSKKISVVTGAAQGIGFAIAELFAEEGSDVVLLDKNTEELQKAFEQIKPKTEQKLLSIVCDVSNQKNVKTTFDKIFDTFDRIDVLINNAGINVFQDPVKLTMKEWQKCMSVDLEGVWHCTQSVLPNMIKDNYGHIVNIASVHGHKIIPNCFPYPVAKHGLIGLTKAIGLQYAAKGIRVNSISPGLIMTQIAKKHFESFDNPKLEEKIQADLLPCKRIGTPKEVAYTALFLASDEAKFINATDIVIDGGRSQLYHE